jgi:carboxyl-terminal processing protease
MFSRKIQQRLARIALTSCLVSGIVLFGCQTIPTATPAAGMVTMALTITPTSPVTSEDIVEPTATLDRIQEALTAVAAAPPANQLTPPATPVSTMSPAAEAYLNEAITIIRENALNSNQVNWDRIETVARIRAHSAVTTEDTYSAIRYVLSQLNDRHSFFRTPADRTFWESLTIEDFPPISSEIIAERVGYIDVPEFGSLDQASVTQQAVTIQSHLAQLAAQNPCGWIVDLRSNSGGNMWPMLAGLGPLLGEGLQGFFVGPDGATFPWYYQNGQALVDDNPLVIVEQPLILEQTDLPVAVLISDQTASSGEAIAVAFRGREGSRFFGAPTFGVSTSIGGYELTDGAMIMLTVAVFADRAGVTYGSALPPDEVTPTDNAAIDAATAWLMTQPSCTMPGGD